MSAEQGMAPGLSGQDKGAPDENVIAPVPSVVVRNASRHPPVAPHVIVFANEKGGVGKSTLAFHACVALSHAGAKVLAIDLDHRQRSLTTSHDLRAATIRALGSVLPTARHLTLEKQSGAMLDQEIRRVGTTMDFVLIDLPGADSPVSRYAMAIADTIITPVGSSVYDIGGFGRINPVTNALVTPGLFARLIQELGEERARAGLRRPDWIVMKNRFRAGERRLETTVDAILAIMSSHYGFRIATGLHESLSFRDLNAYGLTYLDIGLIPALGKRNHASEAAIVNLLLEFDLPGFCRDKVVMRPRRAGGTGEVRSAPVSRQQSQSYQEALRAHRSRT